MKVFSKTTSTVATGATALALGFTLVGPTQPASASWPLIWHLKSVKSGKCLQWNGVGKNVTFAKCQNKYSQYWGAMGTQVASLSNQLGGWCLSAPKKSEKAPIGTTCDKATAIMMNDKRLNHTTYMSAPKKYFKTVKGKPLCGNRTSNKKDMQWKLTP
ncbi:hypothetical protein AB0L85_06290 [Streptomyces sp. NPDC052051]|uniref:hypothetical protein n=1 Tax=Streptomyces sp. NPDC052051 TaxID=3154649 RepID=UPI0034426EB0